MKTMSFFHSGLILLTALNIMAVGTVNASTLIPQTELPGDCIPKFAVSMPVFGPAGSIPRVNAVRHHKLTITMQEIEQWVLPVDTSIYPLTYVDPWTGTTQNCPSVNPQKTHVWAYGVTDTMTGTLLAPANWPGVTIETQRYVPTTVTYVNQLPSFREGGVVQGLISIDKTVHWADPLHVGAMNPCMDNPQGTCSQPYGFSEGETPPAVPHLHGAEDSSTVDGGPDAWFTPDGIHGPGYFTLFNAGPGTAVYRYLNDQEPGTLWFHDHALGATRTNVYSGLEAFYFVRDKHSEPMGLPDGPYDIEMAMQTRQFDTNGQLFFPDGSGSLCGTGQPGDPCLNGPPGNPDIHLFWIPEFIGDVMTVNGAPWPVLNVEPRRYRFRLLDGANARFYDMTFGDAPVYAVGADDNYLDKPEKIDHVFLAPGERIEVIVDFSKLAGQTIDVTNDAPVPYPDGLIPGVDQPGMAQVMRFQVGTTVSTPDHSCDPAMHQCRRPRAMVRLTDGKGHIAPGVKIDRVRQLILKEFANPTDDNPVVVLVNNTYWDGGSSPSINTDFPAEGISELPRVGSTELWEIINLTGDAHPMHTHLTQFQILNRESYDIDGTMGSGIPGGYFGVWSAAFGYPDNLKCAVYSGDPDNPCPGYGPPLDYLTPNSDGAVGGNPAIGPYLLGDATPPAPEESGWKDTAKAMPGQVLRVVIRWTPSSVKAMPNRSYAGRNFYRFDPTKGPGYVWHCHIIDHEDNEMMRPYKVTK
jgi:spore coat protein A